MAKAKPPVSGHTNPSDHLQTWILRVYIHCEGCKKKVFKVLQSIDGVYKTVIDAKQHKATVTGSVDGETLVQKLLKSGKHAEILPESFPTTPAAEGHDLKKKNEQTNTQKEDIPKSDDNNQETADPANGDGNQNKVGGGKKKKKNKKNKGDITAPPNSGTTEGLTTGKPPLDKVGASMEQLNLGTPVVPQMGYSALPYDVPPYHNYYPTPAYGVSYSTAYPSAESSYYTPPVYGYAQSHPSILYPVPPPPSGYGGSAFDQHDDEGGDGRMCIIM